MIKYLLAFLFVLRFLAPGCSHKADPALIGVKIYEHEGPCEELFRQWKDMGINTGFCSEKLISDRAFMDAAREHQISTFLIFPVFHNPEAIARTPDISAITRYGEPAADEWVEFVCPSRKDYRREVVEHARQIVRAYQPDGISIDFIRHFVYWEKVYPGRDPESFPLSCFDSVCLTDFQTETGIHIPEELSDLPAKADWILDNHEEEWTGWRCRLITSMAAEIVRAAREEKPGILVNIHLVPWAKDDFNEAIKRVAGQDISALSEFADFLSPMTYAHMLRQPPSWVHHMVEEVFMQTGGTVLPSIQVGQAYLETRFDLEEFRETVEAALQPPSSGVIIWSWERLISEPAKADLFKDMIRSR
ncbi:MAG: hypothetical protein P1P86_10420 [Bacteroidales bacterium]|nr:hypothetical protein [Bacteroidales bacterium]